MWNKFLKCVRCHALQIGRCSVHAHTRPCVLIASTIMSTHAATLSLSAGNLRSGADGSSYGASACMPVKLLNSPLRARTYLCAYAVGFA